MISPAVSCSPLILGSLWQIDHYQGIFFLRRPDFFPPCSHFCGPNWALLSAQISLERVITGWIMSCISRRNKAWLERCSDPICKRQKSCDNATRRYFRSCASPYTVHSFCLVRRQSGQGCKLYNTAAGERWPGFTAVINMQILGIGRADKTKGYEKKSQLP